MYPANNKQFFGKMRVLRRVAMLCCLALCCLALTACNDPLRSGATYGGSRYGSGYGGYSTNNAARQVGQIFGDMFNNSAQAGSTSNFPTGLPQDYQEFKQRHRSLATSPQGAVKMYFDAVFCTIAGTPTQQADGEKMLRYALHGSSSWQGSHPTLAKRLKDPSYHHIFRSYAAGTSRENGYAMNPNNYQLVFTGTRDDNGLITVFLQSSGADRPRPVSTKRYEDGLWYVFQPAASYSGVQEPPDPRRNTQHDADYD